MRRLHWVWANVGAVCRCVRGMEKSIGVRGLDGGGGVFRTAQNKSIDLKNVSDVVINLFYISSQRNFLCATRCR